ncbi:MAG: GGDEF domain-containing protein, partial [Thermoanaerobaculia bacterium]|nr:GGDEF domain-containing protein [Thermoanaerobaculia bacterium]
HSLERYYTVRNAANLDGLTGILNKRAISHRLSEEIFEAESEGKPLSVFLFDIDNFKHYNDSHGHVAGDELLRELAALVRANTRREHLFGRFGGEEFLIVFQGSESRSALIAAENIRRRINEHPFEHAEEQPLGRVSVSGGVATFPTHGTSSTVLLRKADAALYEAKESGRDQVFLAG